MKQNQRCRSKGQSLVETAIILPVVLLLVMAIIDFGLLFNNYILISNAAREGARKGALGGTNDEIIQTVLNMTPTLKITNMDIRPETPNGKEHGKTIIVSIRYKSELITPLIDKFFPGGVAELYSSSTMRIE